MDKLKIIIDSKPGLKLLSKAKLIKKIRDEHDDIPVKVISEYYDNRELSQVFRPSQSKNKDALKITAEPYSFQIDIIKIPRLQKYNNGIEQFLLLIDVTSRKVFAYPLKSGKMEDVLDQYEKFIRDVGGDVNSVSGDDFFNNQAFNVYNDELGITVHSDVAKSDHFTKQGNKLGIIDRSVRTLKGMINKNILENNTKRWIDFLDEIVDMYNDTPNRGIKNSTPNDVYDDEMYAEKLHENQVKENQKTFNKVKLEIGDYVRHMLGKETFQKEKQKFSQEVYVILEQEGYRYRLMDENGDTVDRLYRPNELQKVDIDKVTDRVDTKSLEEAEKRHKNISKIRKENNNRSYQEVDKALDDAPKLREKTTKVLRGGKKYK